MGVIVDGQNLGQATRAAARCDCGETQGRAEARPRCRLQAGTGPLRWLGEVVWRRLGPAAVAVLSVLGRLPGWCRAARPQDGQNGNIPTFQEAAELAREEWLRAGAYFDQVLDPDLVDYAAYSLRAAERKYVYLLKKARQEPASPMHRVVRGHIYNS